MLLFSLLHASFEVVANALQLSHLALQDGLTFLAHGSLRLRLLSILSKELHRVDFLGTSSAEALDTRLFVHEVPGQRLRLGCERAV